MEIDNIIEKIKPGLGKGMLDFQRKSNRRAYIGINPEVVREASRLMLEELGARFQIATGVDTREGVEIMYHWAMDRDDCVITFRTLLEHEKPQIDSISEFCRAAEWIEREMWELLGIQFNGHPDLRHLLLDDDWPEGDYPLRKNHEVAP